MGLFQIVELINQGVITMKQYANIEYKRIRDTNELNEMFGRLGYTRPPLCVIRSDQHEIAFCRQRLNNASDASLERMTWRAKHLNMSIPDLVRWSKSQDPEWNTGHGEGNDNSKEGVYARVSRQVAHIQAQQTRDDWSWERPRPF